MALFQVPVQTSEKEVHMAGADMNTRTVGGLLAYCDWLRDKGYQSRNAIEAWRTAIKKVFEAVEPDAFEAVSLDDLDLDDYVSRFRTLAGSEYKAETIAVYKRRISNAIEAHNYYREHGKPPSFRKTRSSAPTPSSKGNSPKKKGRVSSPEKAGPQPEGELVQFPFPLRNGQMAELRLPSRLEKADADRLSAFLRALQFEAQAQIPERTGEAEAA
jgi:hypothetical protein